LLIQFSSDRNWEGWNLCWSFVSFTIAVFTLAALQSSEHVNTSSVSTSLIGFSATSLILTIPPFPDKRNLILRLNSANVPERPLTSAPQSDLDWGLGVLNCCHTLGVTILKLSRGGA
jgi:hypothetical protein